MREIIKFGAS